MNLEPNFLKDIADINNIDAVGSILEIVCRNTGMGFAAVARVTEDRWIACAIKDEIEFGLQPGGELKVETTICHEIRQTRQIVAIDHVTEDIAFSRHATPALYGFQSYISVPIILKGGHFFGTLCAIDPKPARVNNKDIIGTFRLFADLIAFHLDAMQELALSEDRLLEEQNTAELREQFIAILGHDLRNPVTASLTSAQLILQMPGSEQVKRLANVIQNSSYRIKGLVENMLDFASGRLGGGIVLNKKENEPIQGYLEQIIAELKVIWPDREIQTRFDLSRPVTCDGSRIAQLFSNVLSNALSYGKKDEPVSIAAGSNEHEFYLSISNAGNKIPDHAIKNLFRPFSRGEAGAQQKGLGLGLFIASQIAIAHEGSIDVESTDKQTCFTLRIPNQ